MGKRIFLSLALLLTTFVSTWAEDVNYIYYQVIDVNNDVSLSKSIGTASNATVLTSSLLENSNEDNLDSGWYVLNSTFSYGERIVISGDVKLILKDGCTLTAKQGIRINTDATLTIYAQSQTVGTMGKLVAIETHHDKAAIGGNKNWEAGRLFIHGGEIEADASEGKYAAGIGGGYGDGSGMKGITIYSGKVTARGAAWGAGIGGGKNNNHPCTINIYGGDITTNGGVGGAGIGGGENRGNWPVNIYNGTVVAKGIPTWVNNGDAGAGIGSGAGGNQTGRINIYGGTVTAESISGAGIGGGFGGDGGEIYIYGGTVTAKTSLDAAGIGGGGDGAGGDIHISGGTITAESEKHGAAIGGGYKEEGGNIEITGGHVTTKVFIEYVWGKPAYNIGSGQNNDKQTITLGINMCVKPENGMVVTSKRIEACKGSTYDGSRISHWWTVEVNECEHSDLTYSYVNESGHTAHCKYCEYTMNEEHRMVAPSSTCETCGYSSSAEICTLSFYQTDTESAIGYMASGTRYVKGQAIALPECTQVPNGMTFAGWVIADLNAIHGIEAADEEPLHQAGEVYTVKDNASFFARYRYDFTPTWTWNENLTSATLTIQAAGGEPISVTPVTVGMPTTVSASMTSEGSVTNTATATYKSVDATYGYTTTYEFSTQHTIPKYWDYSLMEDDNTSMLKTFNGLTGNVRLPYRTFYMDGNWNTLCLPFDVADINLTPFRGATMKELTDASFDSSTGTLTLTFADATSIKAGQAYLIKWPDTGNSHFNLTDVLFQGVTLTNYLCDDEISTDDSGTATVTFMGTYKKLSFDTDDRTVLFIGAGNTLYYPQSGVSIGAQRAYFKLNGLTADDPNSGINSFTLNFGNGETATGISLTPGLSPKGEGSDYWYSLDGRRLSTKPTQKGIYINNGRKVVIK